MDLYTEIPWPLLCEELAKLDVSLREGGVFPLRRVANAPAHDVTASVLGDVKTRSSGAAGLQPAYMHRNPTEVQQVSWRGGRDSNQTEPVPRTIAVSRSYAKPRTKSETCPSRRRSPHPAPSRPVPQGLGTIWAQGFPRFERGAQKSDRDRIGRILVA